MADPKKPPQRQPQVTAAQLADAMVDSYQGLKITEADTQDHFQRLEDRVLEGTRWPAIGGDCLKRLSPGGFVRVLGEAGTRAPSARRVWGTDVNDTRILQILVALPDDGATTVVRSPLPKKCLNFEVQDPETVRFTVTERSSPLGDGGRVLEVEGSTGQNRIRGGSTVVFAYQGVLAIIMSPLGDPGTFPERALKHMQEVL